MVNVLHRFYPNGLTIVLLCLLAVAGPLLGHPDKFDRNQRVGFATMIPARMGEWDQLSTKDSEKLPEALDINELYQVLYSHPTYGQVALTLEYTSDSRREFELHYPDICHSIRGDRVVSYPPRHLELSDGQSIDVATMEWQQRNDGFSAVTAYWYVTPDGVTIDSMELKIKQALSGLFSRPEQAVMVRFDAFYEQTLSPKKRTELFAAINALNRQIESGIDSRAGSMLYKHFETEDI